MVAWLLVVFVLSAAVIAQVNPADDLVDAIKENLRRNNDDYLESTTLNTTTFPTSITGHMKSTATTKHTISESNISNILNTPKNISTTQSIIQRRNFNLLPDGYDFNKNKLILPLSTRNNIQHRLKASRISPEATTTLKPMQAMLNDKLAPTSQNNIPNERSAKLNNFSINSAFLEKNKDLLIKFIQNRLKTQSKYEIATKPTHVLRNNFRGVFDSDSSVEGVTRPTPARAPVDLDMAPAKGSHVHSMRMRGHLCQRSVLMPEGPKYDSAGRIYLGAFTAAGHQYHRTRPPALVLPLCCNCCRKSVLGCV